MNRFASMEAFVRVIETARFPERRANSGSDNRRYPRR